MRAFYNQCTSRYRTTISPFIFLHQNITMPQIGKLFSISRFRGCFDVGKHGIYRRNDCSEIRFQCILLHVSFYFNYGFPLEILWSKTYFEFWLRIRHLFLAISRKHSELDKGSLYQISLAAADYFCKFFRFKLLPDIKIFFYPLNNFTNYFKMSYSQCGYQFEISGCRRFPLISVCFNLRKTNYISF